MTLQPSSEDDPSNQPEANFRNWGRIHVSNWRVWLMKHSIPSTPSWRKCLLKTALTFLGTHMDAKISVDQATMSIVFSMREICVPLLLLQWPWQIWWPHLIPHRRPFQDWKLDWTRKFNCWLLTMNLILFPFSSFSWKIKSTCKIYTP